MERTDSQRKTERAVLCKHLDGKALFTAILRLYAAIHREVRDSVLPAKQQQTEEFREQRRRKRNPSDDQVKKPKPSILTPGSKDPRLQPQGEVQTKNFLAPLG
jgi:hypothetical protein